MDWKDLYTMSGTSSSLLPASSQQICFSLARISEQVICLWTKEKRKKLIVNLVQKQCDTTAHRPDLGFLKAKRKHVCPFLCEGILYTKNEFYAKTAVTTFISCGLPLWWTVNGKQGARYYCILPIIPEFMGFWNAPWTSVLNPTVWSTQIIQLP